MSDFLHSELNTFFCRVSGCSEHSSYHNVFLVCQSRESRCTRHIRMMSLTALFLAKPCFEIKSDLLRLLEVSLHCAKAVPVQLHPLSLPKVMIA